jgi:hypothetical protein
MAHDSKNPGSGNFSYPHPFFRLDNYSLPPSIKELFKWIRAIFYTDAMVGSTIHKIAEYPITDLIFQTDNKKVRDVWSNVFHDTLDIRSVLIQIGLDHFCYGNAFVSVYFPFTRQLKCGSCDAAHRIEDVDYKVTSKVQFRGKCPACKAMVGFEVLDIPLKRMDRINLVRWNPENISIKYNPASGRSHYRYSIPASLRKEVMAGTTEIINDLPMTFIEAIKKNKAVKLAQNNIFHFKRPTLAEDDMGWGKPLLLHSMKRVFYLNVLRKAQEQIAVEHIIPMDILFPTANGPANPFQHTDLSTVRSHIEQAIERHRKDRNYKPVFPIPIGTARVGGDGRAMLLGPEIDAVVSEIAAGMGVPREFVFGGLSWTGSSVSLRMLENHFLIYRRLMSRFLDWTKNMIRDRFDLPDVSLRFSDFKMADDIQKKQLVMQLNAAQKISTKTLYEELGFDPGKMVDEIKAELSEQAEMNEQMTKDQARAQGEALLIQTLYQGKSQGVMAEQQVYSQEKQKDLLSTVNPQQHRTITMQDQAAELQALMQLQQLEMQLQQMQMQDQTGMPPEGQPEQAPPGAEQMAPEGQQMAPGGQQMAPEGQGEMMQQEGQQMAPGGAEQSPTSEADRVAMENQLPPTLEQQDFSTPGGQGTLSVNPQETAAQWAGRLKNMAPMDRQQYEMHIQTTMPNMWRMMAPYMLDAVDMRAMPEGGPPMRENSPI